MEIKPPQIDVPATPREERRLSNMTSLLLTFGIILVITIAIWMALWGGGIRQAAQADRARAVESK